MAFATLNNRVEVPSQGNSFKLTELDQVVLTLACLEPRLKVFDYKRSTLDSFKTALTLSGYSL